MSFFQDLKQRSVFRVAAAYSVVAWLLLQIASVILPTFEAPAWIMQAFTVSLFLGFPVAFVLAWAFDLTPEGVRLASSSEPAEESAQAAHSRLNIATIALLAFTVIFMFVENYFFDRDGRPSRTVNATTDATMAGQNPANAYRLPNSVAVLPFEDISEDGDQQYFADGVAESVLNALTSVWQLHVIARTSTFSFRGTDTRVSEIADRLNVSYVLEGTVRTAGDQIRVSVQLVDGSTEARLWSEDYTQGLGNVFEIQDDIASNVVFQLTSGALNIISETDIAADPQAYQLYLQAKQVLQSASHSADALTRALAWLDDAIRRDPDYFPAHIARVDVNEQMLLNGMLEGETSDEALGPLVEAVAARWPDRPEVRVWQARLDIRSQRWESAARRIEYALGADPANVDYLATASNLATLLNRPALALEIGKFTVARDPLCAVCYLALAEVLMRLDQYEAAVENYEVANTLDPTIVAPFYPIALVFLGQAEAALKVLQSSDFTSGRLGLRLSSLGGSAIALHHLGRFEEAQEAIEGLRQLGASTQTIAQVYAQIGDLDAAFEAINSLPTDRILQRFFDASLRDLKDHPNWPELGSRIGLWPEDSREAISFSVNLP